MPKSKNDQKILSLQKKIDQKKEALSKAQRFSPKTNCTLEFEGERYNLNTQNAQSCMILAIRINVYRMSAKDLGITDPVIISGYSLDDWTTDLMAKLAHLQRRDESRNLRDMEDRLQTLLSEDTQTEIAIGDIEKELA